MARKKTNASVTKKAAQAASVPAGDATRIYTLAVFIVGGPVTEEFVKQNPETSRTIEMRGDQTLKDLHHAIFDAFDREDEHLYEFQFGDRPMDPQNRCYVLPSASAQSRPGARPPAGLVGQTTLDSLGHLQGDRFGYWFDFGDDWWHQVNVAAVEQKTPSGKYPRVTKKVGKSPPQYADLDE